MVIDMIKVGDKFKVVKNGIVGEIVSAGNGKIFGKCEPIFTVCFTKPNDSWYYNADVFYSTIVENLSCKVYERM